jgi:hypothetical protein
MDFTILATQLTNISSATKEYIWQTAAAVVLLDNKRKATTSSNNNKYSTANDWWVYYGLVSILATRELNKQILNMYCQVSYGVRSVG